MSTSPFHDLTPEQTRAHRETVLLRLLLRTTQTETAEVARRLATLGHAGVSAAAIGLLGNVDTEGTRLVVLAQRTGSSRQAVSQLVKDIEKKGYLERTPDPEDGRAVLVRHTKAGRRLLGDALEQMDDIERGYEQQIGAADMQRLKALLTKLADSIGPDSRLGR